MLQVYQDQVTDILESKLITRQDLCWQFGTYEHVFKREIVENTVNRIIVVT